jgi:hypothetical protein
MMPTCQLGTCWPIISGNPANSFLCCVANMSANMMSTGQLDKHMSVVLTPVLTCRHPTIPAKVWQWLLFGWFWGWGTSDTQLARWKLSKKNTPQSWQPPSPYGCHGALLLAPPHAAISQHAAQQVYVVKTRKYYCFYYLLRGIQGFGPTPNTLKSVKRAHNLRGIQGRVSLEYLGYLRLYTNIY